MNLKNLVFQGGGARGIAYIGALEVIDNLNGDNSYLQKEISTVAGTSAGAITAFMIACGMSSKEIKETIYDVNLENFFDFKISELKKLFDNIINGRDPISNAAKILTIIEALFREKGMNDISKFRTFLEKEILEKKGFNKGITFLSLKKKTNKSLYIFASNVPGERLVCFSNENEDTATTSVVDAVCASIALPFYIRPSRIQIESGTKHDLYIDGGVAKNYPIDYKYDDNLLKRLSENVYSKELTETLGFCFGLNTRKEVNDEISSIDFFSKIIKNYFFPESVSSVIDDKFLKRSVFIDTEEVGALDFDLSDEQKDKIILNAKKSTEKWLDNNII